MSASRNPFLERTSERLGERPRFVHTFAANAVSILPDDPWTTLMVLRSSPGAGKTSLMRLFDAETLTWIATHRVEPLRERLVELRALAPDGAVALRLGVLIDLRTGYKTVLDAAELATRQEALFRRLLDSRMLGGVIRSALRLSGLRFPADAGRFVLRPNEAGPELDALAQHLGGYSGDGLLEYARATERLVLLHTDHAIGRRENSDPDGHAKFMALDLLDRTSMFVSGSPVHAEPLIMFDDGHALPPSLRALLLAELQRRFTRVGRWYAERQSALEVGELIGDGSNIGRDLQVIDLDSLARAKRSRHSTTLREMAQLRAAETLRIDAQENRSFFELLADAPSDLDPFRAAANAINERVRVAAGDNRRYLDAAAHAAAQGPPVAVERLATLLVAIHRDLDKQQTLFPEPMTVDEAELNSSIREGARTQAAVAYRLPYYAGSERLLRLASGNADQFMMLCGDLFAEMLVSIGVGRDPTITFERQHRLMKAAARDYWTSIPRVLPQGRRVQRFIERAVAMAKSEDARPKLPYPPGVTGFSIWTRYVEDLKASSRRLDRELLSLLADCVAHNVLGLDTDRQSKNQPVFVFYFNRLICAHFDLVLGYGGHREQRPETLHTWASSTQDALL